MRRGIERLRVEVAAVGTMGDLRRRAAAELRRRPNVQRGVTDLTELLGLQRVTDRLDRAGTPPGTCTVRLPAATRSGRGRLTMDAADGRDQSVVALRTSWDAFEPPMPQVFLELSRRLDGRVLDIGANTGIYALLAAVGARRAVTAFEPVPSIRELLDRNVALSAVTTSVDVRGVAVGAEAGQATLYLPPPSGPVETSASLSPDFKETIGSELTVPVMTLDGWWRQAGRPAVGVVKIDVESREADVLRGAEQLVAAEQPWLFVEVLPQGDAGWIDEFARRHGYLDVRLHPAEAVVGGEVAFDPDGWNHLLVPAAGRPLLAEVLTAAGLADR